MLRRSLLCTAILAAALPGLRAGAAASPCSVSWSDPSGDGVFNTGTGFAKPKVSDEDLDAVQTTVRATATDVVVTVRVARLHPAGPGFGTGHGVSLVVNKYGKTMVFAARKDATYGDAVEAPDRDSVVRLALDQAQNAFVLTVRRADLTRVSGAASDGGDLTGMYVSTIRYDQGQAAMNATPLGAAHAGLGADETSPGDDGASLSLDACDAALRATSLKVTYTGPSTRRVVTATLVDGLGAPLAGQPVRIATATRVLATGVTSAAGVARFALAGGRTVVVVYDGVTGAHAPARVTVRL